MALWRKSARSIFSLKRSEAARRPAALLGPFESQPASASDVSAPAPVTRLAPRKARRSRPSFSAAWRGGSQSLLTTTSRSLRWIGDRRPGRPGRCRWITGGRLRGGRVGGGVRGGGGGCASGGGCGGGGSLAAGCGFEGFVRGGFASGGSIGGGGSDVVAWAGGRARNF